MSFNEQELRDAYANAGRDQLGGNSMWEKFTSTRELGSGKRTQDISQYKTLLAELDNERRNQKSKPSPTPTPSPTPRLIPRPTPAPAPTPTPILDDSSSSPAKDLAVGSNKNFDNNIVGNNNSNIGNDRSYNYGNQTEADYNEKKSSPDTPNKLQAAKDLAEARLTSNVTTDSKQTVGSNKDFKNEITGNDNKNIGNDYSVSIGNQGGGSGGGLNNMQDAMAFNEKKSSPDTPNKLQAAKDLAEARLTSNVTTDSKQTVGSNKDFKNEITGNDNKNIGNDYSVSIGNQGGGSGGGLNNMQDAMAFIGLNDNRAAKDEALFNPYDDVGLSMKAIDDAAGKNVDQRLYNSIGYDMNYYDDKAKEIDNMTFGDIGQFQAPDYKMPSSPSDPFKKVKS